MFRYKECNRENNMFSPMDVKKVSLHLFIVSVKEQHQKILSFRVKFIKSQFLYITTAILCSQLSIGMVVFFILPSLSVSFHLMTYVSF